jgi:hypothetical protein
MPARDLTDFPDGSVFALDHLQTVSDSKNTAFSFSDQVLPEEHMVTDRAVLTQRPQWLWPRALARLLVYRRDHAALTRLDDVKVCRADANLSPPVFIVRRRAGDDEIGAKAIHRKRAIEPSVQVSQRGLSDEVKRIAVGEADNRIAYCILRIDFAPRLVGHINQSARRAEIPAEPPVGELSDQKGLTGAPPYFNRDRGASGRALQLKRYQQRLHAGCARLQPFRSEAYGTERHARIFALRKERAVRVHEQPSSIMLQTSRLDLRFAERDAAQRFYRIDIDGT